MSLKAVALVSQSPRLRFQEVVTVAGVLQRQVNEHLWDAWGVDATILPLDDINRLERDCAPIIIRDQIDQAGVWGYHAVKDTNPLTTVDDWPYAMIQWSERTWTLDASHECLEMILDPLGRARQQSIAPMNVGYAGPVDYLVEVCDPCGRESAAREYLGVLISDFATPEYYQAGTPTDRASSYYRLLTSPRTLLPGGYISWQEMTAAGKWWRTERSQSNMTTREVPTPVIYGSYREQIDRDSTKFLSRYSKTKYAQRTLARRIAEADAQRAEMRKESQRLARLYRAEFKDNGWSAAGSKPRRQKTKNAGRKKNGEEE